MTLLLHALAACTPSSPCPTCGGPDDTALAGDSGADSGSDSGGETADTAVAALNGTYPDATVPAPVFTVLNQDEQVRTRDDLLGHPTVMWFYPAAGTSG